MQKKKKNSCDTGLYIQALLFSNDTELKETIKLKKKKSQKKIASFLNLIAGQ